ncbi:MAG: hypothetical protein JWP63_3941, partial [Candidatus Solibacter sp.]|nr:hypothetical protein [Candidatus Solibacter sp.]
RLSTAIPCGLFTAVSVVMTPNVSILGIRAASAMYKFPAASRTIAAGERSFP